MFIAQDAKEDKDYNYCYLHCQQHIYHIISDRCTSCIISIDHHSRAALANGKGGGGLPITSLSHFPGRPPKTPSLIFFFERKILYVYSFISQFVLYDGLI